METGAGQKKKLIPRKLFQKNMPVDLAKRRHIRSLEETSPKISAPPLPDHFSDL